MRNLVAVVDDDASVRRSLKSLLSSAGFVVEVFSSAEAFVQSSAVSTASCLVLDLRMPGMGGLGLVHLLERRGTRIPIVILTAVVDAEMRERCVAAGVRAFLGKPFLGDDLLQTVKGALST